MDKNINNKNREQQSTENSTNKVVIPAIKEHLKIEKKEVETGKITITKKVHNEQQTVDIPVVEENVDVERIPFNQYIESAPPAVRYEGEKTIIPILKEVLVVEKKLVLVEEIHIIRKQHYSKISQQEILRQEEIIVNRG